MDAEVATETAEAVQDLKDEVQDLKDEAKDLKDEVQDLKDEAKDLKDEFQDQDETVNVTKIPEQSIAELAHTAEQDVAEFISVQDSDSK